MPVTGSSHENAGAQPDGDDGLRRIAPRRPGRLGKLQDVIESAPFQHTITGLIALNALTLGLETSATVMAAVGGLLLVLDKLILVVFVLELSAKLVVYGRRFHKDPWNLFDLIVVTIALIPATGSLSVLRALRILRVLRLVSTVPAMRRVVSALLAAIPGMGSIVGLLSLIFYVFRGDGDQAVRQLLSRVVRHHSASPPTLCSRS